MPRNGPTTPTIPSGSRWDGPSIAGPKASTIGRWRRGGVFLVVAKLECRYTGSLRYDDLAVIETRLVRVGRRILEFSYRVTESSSGAVAALGSTILVPVDEAGRVVSLPDDVFSLLTPCTEEEPAPVPSLSDISLPSGG